MTQAWNNTGFPAAATTDDIDVAGAALINGVKTALTRYWGSADPSSGAPTAWGSAELGTEWWDSTDTDNPVRKVWSRLTAAPTYGWRTLRYPKLKWLTTPAAVTFSPASPAAADVVYTDVDLTSLLDSSCQDAGQLLPVVKAVLLRIRVRETGTIATGDNTYFKIRGKGTTDERKLYCKVSSVYEEQDVWVSLDSAGAFQFGIDVGSASPNVEYEAWVRAIVEET